MLLRKLVVDSPCQHRVFGVVVEANCCTRNKRGSEQGQACITDYPPLGFNKEAIYVRQLPRLEASRGFDFRFLESIHTIRSFSCGEFQVMLLLARWNVELVVTALVPSRMPVLHSSCFVLVVSSCVPTLTLSRGCLHLDVRCLRLSVPYVSLFLSRSPCVCPQNSAWSVLFGVLCAPGWNGHHPGRLLCFSLRALRGVNNSSPPHRRRQQNPQP